MGPAGGGLESRAVSSRKDWGEKKTRSYPGGARESTLWFLMS